MTITTASSPRMKARQTAIIAILVALALNCGTGAFAQGLINFVNSSSFLINISSNAVITPTPAGVPGTYRYELFIAPAGTVNPASFTATGVIATNTSVAGRLSGGSGRAVPGVPLGGVAAILVRGWSANLGSTYAAALTAYQTTSGYIGTSIIAPNFQFGGDGGSGNIPSSPAFGGAFGITSGFILYGSLIYTPPPYIYTQPVSQSVFLGSNVTFLVLASGGNPLTYQWRKAGANISGATNTSHNIASAAVADAGNYDVVVVNPYGSVTSSVATLTVNTPVTFTLHPASQVVSLHGAVAFDSSAQSIPAATYQWQFNGEYIPGANGSSLVITNVGTNRLGDYSVVASNPYSIVTSAVATLLMSPSFQTPFVGTTAIWGKDATLSVLAQGSGQLTYQWFKDGVAINSGTNSSLLFPSVLLTDGGLYSVVVTSTLGSVTNTPAQLVVNPANISLGLYAGITVDGVPGFTYGIQYSSDLTDTNSWVTLTNLTLTQPVEVWMDPSVDVHAAGSVKRFYRVIAP
jgi:hypothetical protein